MVGRPKRTASKAGHVVPDELLPSKKTRKEPDNALASPKGATLRDVEIAKTPPKKSPKKVVEPLPVSRPKRKIIPKKIFTQEPQGKRAGTRVGTRASPRKSKTSRNAAVAARSTTTSSRASPKKKTPKRATKAESEEEETESEEDEDSSHRSGSGISYWLMKAEPESRIEKGKDVKFSIDDLKACAEPEAWDGVRNPTARNNLKAMKKGDLAFFYHSNCKTPGIAGIMEIVKENSVDESAFDKDHPYYDEKSTKDDPKWFVVHVEFRHKFKELIKLKELQRFALPGGILDHMQMLKQSRLSVSKVSMKEWKFINTLGNLDEEAEPEYATITVNTGDTVNGK